MQEEVTEKNLKVTAYITKLIERKGSVFVEQKFSSIIQRLNKAANLKLLSTELYAEIFPDLKPTLAGIEKVLFNALQNTSSFQPLFHSSEYVYRQWLKNFEESVVVKSVSKVITIDYLACKNALEEFQSWVPEYPFVSSEIRSHINWDLKDLQENNPVIYNPKNLSVKAKIFEQLEKNKCKCLHTTDIHRNFIEIKRQGEYVILTRTKRYEVASEKLQNWLNNFGISVSMTTLTYLKEYGLPYGGETISFPQILTGSKGVISILGFELKLLLSFTDTIGWIELNRHPLKQSVVLALARLEYFLNPEWSNV